MNKSGWLLGSTGAGWVDHGALSVNALSIRSKCILLLQLHVHYSGMSRYKLGSSRYLNRQYRSVGTDTIAITDTL
jgi:hypothetical protein